MSTTFTPTPADISTYTEVADGDNQNGASVGVMLEALANAAAATARVPFNWGKSSGTTHNLKRGAWFNGDQAWFGVGDGGVDFLEVSFDGGRSWKDLISSLGSSLSIADIATNDTNTIITVAETVRTTYVGTKTAYGAYTFVAHTNAILHALTLGALSWDASHSKFLACYRSSTTGVFVESSPDGVTFTAATLPGSWTGSFSSEPVVESNATGKSVALFYDNGATTYRTVHSSDGATWSATDVAAGLTASVVTRPVYNPILNEWYFAASKTAGGRQTEILRSANDGATWTSLGGGAADMALQNMVCVIGVLVGVNDDGRIFFSVDRGQSWKLATCNPIASAAKPGMRAANGQIVVWNSADKTTFATARHGAAGV